MAQPSSRVITSDRLDKADSRQHFLEMGTHPYDYASGEYSILLSTMPFLAPGDHFADVPIYLIGLTQSFSWNEAPMGQMVPEIGSSRKANTAGTAAGSGVISKIIVHGSSLAASLYRPTLQFILTSETLAPLRDKLLSGGDPNWISGLATQDLDLFSAELNAYSDRVIAPGGMSALLYKIPFGLIEVKRDPKNRVVAINYFEQCGIRGNQGGVNAGQFQLADSLSFEFERMRPLRSVGPFVLSDEQADGLPED
jgi:hypothetical protein